eukprot:gene8027-biopygen277
MRGRISPTAQCIPFFGTLATDQCIPPGIPWDARRQCRPYPGALRHSRGCVREMRPGANRHSRGCVRGSSPPYCHRGMLNLWQYGGDDPRTHPREWRFAPGRISRTHPREWRSAPG